MINGLKKEGIDVTYGHKSRFFGILLTAFSRPDYIHFDWIQRYYIRSSKFLSLIFLPFFILQVFLCKYIFGVKIVWTLHNLEPHDQIVFFANTFARKYFAKEATWIRVFSEDSAIRTVKKLGVALDKIIVIPEGSYIEFYPNDISSQEARSYLGLDPDRRVFLFFGNIRPYKGLENLISKFQECLPVQSQLLIVGSCNNTSYCKHIKRQAFLKGDIRIVSRFIDVKDVQLWLNACDIVVLPFEKVENSGSVILSMGFSKPVVAPRMGVLVSRLSNQEKLLYEEGALCQALQYANHVSVSELKAIGKLNYLKAKEHEWQDFAKAFI